MTTVVSVQWPVASAVGRICCLLLTAVCLLACSVPNLGEPDCEAARDTVREFYSWYFAADAEHRKNSPEVFQKYVAPTLRRGANGEIDPFVLTNDFPKAFRVGECKVVEAGTRTQFEVLLFWKDDIRSEQRTIKVKTENVDGKWLIQEVTP